MGSYSSINEDDLIFNQYGDDRREEDVEQEMMEEENAEKEDVGDDQLQEEGYCKKPRRKISKVWDEMTIVNYGKIEKVQCNHCKELLAKLAGGTTTHLRRHQKTCLKRKIWLGEQNKQKQQVLSFTETTTDGNTSITNFAYDHAKVRELASHMVLVHEYAFSMMEHVVFNKFCKAISPFYTKISRYSVKKDCFTTYENEKKKLKNVLRGVSRISVTTDLWKSGQNVQYMVLTGHFVDCDWKLQKRVLNFCNVPPPHTGVIIADALSKCFFEWGIEDKVSSITVDNAKYNDVCVRRLKEDMMLRKKLSIGGDLFHVRCCAHILNLLVKDGLEQIQDVIETVREGVKYLKYSESRLIEFSKIKNQLQLPSKNLMLDCPTRWNGTYMMLASALEVKDVFPRYSDIDPGFKYVPTTSEWRKVEDLCQFLGVFNEITNIISGSEYPTSNLFLVELKEIKDLLNEKALDYSENIRAMAARMATKFDKYWGDSNVLISLAAILDPRYKMHLINIAFVGMYGEKDAPEHIEKIKQKLNDLYDEYVAAHVSTTKEQNERHLGNKKGRKVGSSSFGGETGVIGKGILTGKVKFQMLMSQIDTAPPEKSELQIYLTENRYTCDAHANLDVIGWWKGERLRFPILSKMAVDILSIPITSVASESTFSAGGRVIDDRRASMSVDTVQMLLCAGDWVRNIHGIKRNGQDEREDELADAFQKITLPDSVS